MPERLIAALLYNENKVAKGKAICLHAEGFLRDANEMNVKQKTQGFERLNCRNERAKTKTLHISLNFDPSEKLSNEKLKQIADSYIRGIGFDVQPYLVYRHNDAGHPHIHIVTTTIREDGSRINTHNIGRNQSEKARIEIERNFNLVKASDKKRMNLEQITPVKAALVYGTTETRQAINRVVSTVLQNYLFASLPELNVILRKYGVQAEQGIKDSRVLKHNGLNYRMLDANMKPAGVPIKASLLTGKPTLQRLNTIFEKNIALKEPFKATLKKQINDAIAQGPSDLTSLQKLLAGKNIDLILRQAADKSGRIYGITFLDENNKVVFNGGDLGKKYSAAHLKDNLQASSQNQSVPKSQRASPIATEEHTKSMTEILLQTEQEFNYQPVQLLKKKRKRKQNYLGL